MGHCATTQGLPCCHTWNGSLLPAWLPPLITFKHGTGRTLGLAFPASAARWRYNGSPLAAAPALATASDTPKIALAPIDADNVRQPVSPATRRLHTLWLRTHLALVGRAIAINHRLVDVRLECDVKTLDGVRQRAVHVVTSLQHACQQPFESVPQTRAAAPGAGRSPLPRYRSPPSRSSTASWTPVDAPLGTAARNKPRSVVTSTSTVGLPRLRAAREREIPPAHAPAQHTTQRTPHCRQAKPHLSMICRPTTD